MAVSRCVFTSRLEPKENARLSISNWHHTHDFTTRDSFFPQNTFFSGFTLFHQGKAANCTLKTCCARRKSRTLIVNYTHLIVKGQIFF